MTKFEVRRLEVDDLATLQMLTPEAQVWGAVTRDKFAALQAHPSFTGLVDGQIVACGGIINIWTGLAEAWLALTPYAKLHVPFVYRHVHAFLDTAISTYNLRRIQTTVLADWAEANKFIERLGFIAVAPLEKYGMNGETHILYEMVM